MTTTHQSRLVPLLVVRGAARALDFYVRALGARVLAHYQHGPERHTSHADLLVRDTPFSVTEELRAFGNDAPPALGGTAVVLQLFVDDVDATLAALRDAGATTIFPVQELFGERMARVGDPFGHVWMLRQRLVELSVEELRRQRDELFDRFARQARRAPAAQARPESTNTLEPIAGHVHLVIGPVGAGKSSFALRLAREKAALRLTLDEWMSRLFSPDRPSSGSMPWYTERAARAVDQIWSTARAVTALGTDVILEIGLLRRTEREHFYRRLDDAGLRATIYVLDAARDVRRARVAERNRTQGETFSMVVPAAIFELASDLWEPPADDELAGRDVQLVRTDG